MDAVLRLVDEQEAVPAAPKRQSNTEQPHRPVAKTLERDRVPVALEPRDHPVTVRPLPTPCAVPDHRNANRILVDG